MFRIPMDTLWYIYILDCLVEELVIVKDTS